MNTVLLAYEREQDLAAVETVLQARGLRILKARSGVEALDLIRTESPDAIVSDVQLPKLDGFALCRRLREDPATLQLPFVLHSFRVAGPKYEAFAAEVGAHRFLPKGSRLEDLAGALEERSPPGSGTVRIPALVPELLDKREQDRRRLLEVERQLRDLEAANKQLTAAERVARERAEHEAKARAEFVASESARVRELAARIRELEGAQRQVAEAESATRGAAEETRADAARLAALETRLTEVQASRSRAQAAVADAERAFAVQPTATWLVEMVSMQVLAASDTAAAMTGLEPAALRGKALGEVLPGAVFADDAREATIAWQRADGTRTVLELRRQALSFAGRGSWIVTAQDVTNEKDAIARADALVVPATMLERSADPCGVVDLEGRFRFGNRALLLLLGVDAARLGELTLQRLGVEAGGDSTIRSVALGVQGDVRQAARWRRGDGVELDVELAMAPYDEAGELRVVSVRDVSLARRVAERDERDHTRVNRLLDLTHRAHALTETEILDRALHLAQELTHSPLACLFLAVGDGTLLELTVRHGGADDGPNAANRWRGMPAQHTALYEALSSQRTVVRDAAEGTGPLRQAGLPESLQRQVVTPLSDGGRLAGILLLADAPGAYDDDARRQAAQVADTVCRLLRRRRSDAEIVSAMDHMERVMTGTIEALAHMVEVQDSCKDGRARRVADHAAAIGVELGLPGHTVRGLRVMGQLIDVGMLQLPRELLWRPGALTAAEFELVKTHAEHGYELLRGIEFPWPVAEVVRQHHERLDGSGYPRGLRGDEILLEARIVAVADAVEAMLSPRPHRAALDLATCVEELQSQAGRRYDARVVKACVKLLRDEAPATATQHQEGEAPAGQRIA